MVLKLLLMTVINHCRWPFCNSGRGWSARMLACDAPHKCAPNPLPPLCLLTPGLFTSIDLWLQWFLLQDSRIEANLCWSSCRSPAHVMRAKNCSVHIFIDVTYATESGQLAQGIVARVGGPKHSFTNRMNVCATSQCVIPCWGAEATVVQFQSCGLKPTTCCPSLGSLANKEPPQTVQLGKRESS
jgi:hypothetical protein